LLKINEIYHSIQGESSNAGMPCVFVRLTYCNLRCTYCDTEYAFYEGGDKSVDEIISEECYDLLMSLCEKGFDVLLETAGNMPITNVDNRVKIIMDLKCPSSKMEKKNLYDNINHIKPEDEIKFVIGNREDYDWTKDIMNKYNLSSKCEILFSVVFGELEPLTLVNWILEDKLDVRYQLQMHKYIWHPETKSV